MEEAALALHALAKEARLNVDDAALDRIGAEMIALGQSSDDLETIAWGNYHRGIALNNLSRGSEAEKASREAVALFTTLGDRFAAARAMMNLAVIELDINVNTAEARRLYEESITIIRDSGEPLRLGIALGNLAEIIRLEGDYHAAIATARESLAFFTEAGDFASTSTQWVIIAHCQALIRDYSAAMESMRAAYEPLRDDPNPRWIALYFDTWVIVAAMLFQLNVAAELLGFVDLYRFENNVRRLHGMLPFLSAPKERIAQEFSPERLHELTLAGEAMSVEEAQALAATVTV